MNTHKNINIPIYSKFAVAIAVALGSSAPFAEELEADISGVERIVVSGEKLGRTTEETTNSVIIYTGDLLEQKSIQDLYDIVTLTPNVGQSFGEKGFSIRGIDQRFAGGGGLLITTVVDGAALPNNQATFFGPYSAWDLEQVEVLRGPQGTTQGRNAVGGAIIINTANPDFDEFSGRVRASYAELGTYQTAGVVNIPLIDNELAMRVALEKRETDGWVDNPTRGVDNYDARNFENARLKLRWAPNDDLNILYTLNSTDSLGGEDAIDVAQFPERRVNASGGIGQEGSEHLINTLQVDYNLNDYWSMTSVSTVYQQDYIRQEDADFGPADLIALDLDQEDETFTQEVRFVYDNNENLRWLFGGFFFDFDNEATQSVTVPLAFLGFPAEVIQQFNLNPLEEIAQVSSFNRTERNFAFFTEAEYDLNDSWTIITGLRYDNEERTFANLASVEAQNVPDVLVPPGTETSWEADFDALLPKLAIRYQAAEHTYLGLSAQRAYRAGGTAISLLSQMENEFDPEYTWTYEATVRTTLLDGDLILDGNLYYTDWTNMQISVLAPNAISPLDSVTDNAGSSRLYGLEIQAKWQATEELDLNLALGTIDSKLIDYVANAGTPNENDLSGEEFAYSPDMSLSLAANYIGENGFVARFDANWVDEQVSEIGLPDTTVSAYWVVNGKVGYEAEDWSINLFARNLLDKDYLTQRFAPGRDLLTGAQTFNGRSAEPRVIGIEVNYSF